MTETSTSIPVDSATGKILSGWWQRVVVLAAPATAVLYFAMDELARVLFGGFSLKPEDVGLSKASLLETSVPVSLILGTFGAFMLAVGMPIAMTYTRFLRQQATSVSEVTMGALASLTGEHADLRHHRLSPPLRTQLRCVGIGFTAIAAGAYVDTPVASWPSSSAVILTAAAVIGLFFALIPRAVKSPPKALGLAYVIGGLFITVAVFGTLTRHAESDASVLRRTGQIQSSLIGTAVGFNPVYVEVVPKAGATPAWLAPLQNRVMIDLGHSGGTHQVFDCTSGVTYPISESDAELPILGGADSTGMRQLAARAC